MLNKRGLRRLPWGTPQRIGVQLEQLLHITLCFRSCKNDLSSLRAVSCSPYAFNFASSRLWQSKAFPCSLSMICYICRSCILDLLSFRCSLDISASTSLTYVRCISKPPSYKFWAQGLVIILKLPSCWYTIEAIKKQAAFWRLIGFQMYKTNSNH